MVLDDDRLRDWVTRGWPRLDRALWASAVKGPLAGSSKNNDLSEWGRSDPRD